MARRLTGQDAHPRLGRHTGYPWHEWFDGSVWELRRGEDFDTLPRSFMDTARKAAIRRGERIRTAIRGDSLFLQRQ